MRISYFRNWKFQKCFPISYHNKTENWFVYKPAPYYRFSANFWEMYSIPTISSQLRVRYWLLFRNISYNSHHWIFEFAVTKHSCLNSIPDVTTMYCHYTRFFITNWINLYKRLKLTRRILIFLGQISCFQNILEIKIVYCHF